MVTCETGPTGQRLDNILSAEILSGGTSDIAIGRMIKGEAKQNSATAEQQQGEERKILIT